jgi:hypothetical protein
VRVVVATVITLQILVAAVAGNKGLASIVIALCIIITILYSLWSFPHNNL